MTCSKKNYKVYKFIIHEHDILTIKINVYMSKKLKSRTAINVNSNVKSYINDLRHVA